MDRTHSADAETIRLTTNQLGHCILCGQRVLNAPRYQDVAALCLVLRRFDGRTRRRDLPVHTRGVPNGLPQFNASSPIRKHTGPISGPLPLYARVAGTRLHACNLFQNGIGDMAASCQVRQKHGPRFLSGQGTFRANIQESQSRGSNPISMFAPARRLERRTPSLRMMCSTS